MTTSLRPEMTAEEAAEGTNLSGKIAVITGVSAGLGVETARVMALHGAEIVAVVRDTEKASNATREIRDTIPGAKITFIKADLFDLDSVKKAGDEIAARFPKIHYLINNAGVMAHPLKRTKEGLDIHLGTNHLGHFVLTARVIENLLAAAPARIVNLTSSGHRWSPLRFDDPFFANEADYDKMVAYGQSKTAAVLFSIALEKRFGGRGLHSIAVHPGIIITELGRHFTEEEIKAQLKLLDDSVHVKNVGEGAATTVWAALTPEFEDRGGVFCEDCGIPPVIDTNEENAHGVMRHAMDKDAAERLWTLSEEWADQPFPS